MTIWIVTNGRPSNGAKALSKQPGFARAYKGGKIKPKDIVINWGSTKEPPLNYYKGKILNPWLFVVIAANKLNTFQELDEISTPDWTTSIDVAQGWSNNGSVVVARTKLTGHSGDGIIIVDKQQPVPDAPLYTKYVFKEKEFRVHVVGKNVIDTQRKIKDPTKEVLNWKVRSHDNGFIFARNNIDPDPARDELAVAATSALELDFGAVDIIQDKAGAYYVLEINTAPGLEGQTVESYANAFRNA